MSGVMHPVGPEPSERYWVRRAVVGGLAVLVLALVIGLWNSATGTGSAVQAAPPPPVTSPAVVPATTTPTPSATRVSTAASPSSSTTVSGSASPSASRSASSAKPSSSPTAEASAPPKAQPVTTCVGKRMRASIAGQQTLERKQPTQFSLSLTNRSDRACYLELNSETFVLTVVSGKDRIWSSADCSRLVSPTIRKVPAGKSATWSMAWDGRRSAKDCGTRPEVPRPGTYVAKATFDGAKTARLRFTIDG